MIKLAVLVFAAAVFVQGRPGTTKSNDDIAALINFGEWDKAQKLILSKLEQDKGLSTLDLGHIKELKPLPGRHVYGESQITFQESLDVNGKTLEKSGGHKVINVDGNVTEYDFPKKLKYSS